MLASEGEKSEITQINRKVICLTAMEIKCSSAVLRVRHLDSRRRILSNLSGSAVYFESRIMGSMVLK